jgi:hypothetical protein
LARVPRIPCKNSMYRSGSADREVMMPWASTSLPYHRSPDDPISGRSPVPAPRG